MSTKKILKIVLAIIAGSIVFVAILFLVKPTYLMKLLKPIELNITSVNTKISETDISTDIKVELSTDYFVDLIIDSLVYEFYLDKAKVAHGNIAIGKNFSSKDKDTLTIPVSIHKDTLTSKLDSLAPTDSTKVRLWLNNHIKLPILGRTAFEIDFEKKIAAPKLPKIKIAHIDEINLRDTIFNIDFEVNNPSLYEATINRFNADIDFKKLFTGKVKNDTKVRLKPQGTTVFSATIAIDDLELIRDGLKILFQANKEWAYTMDSQVTVQLEDGSTIDFDVLNSGKMDIIGKK